MTFGWWMIALAVQLILCIMTAWFYGAVWIIRTEVRKRARIIESLVSNRAIWPVQVDHYFSWIVTDNCAAFLTSKVAYETDVQAGLMGYQIWRDYARYERREWEVYVLKVSIDAAGDNDGNVGLNDIAMGGTGGGEIPYGVAAKLRAMPSGGGAVASERAGMARAVEPSRSG